LALLRRHRTASRRPRRRPLLHPRHRRRRTAPPPRGTPGRLRAPSKPEQRRVPQAVGEHESILTAHARPSRRSTQLCTTPALNAAAPHARYAMAPRHATVSHTGPKRRLGDYRARGSFRTARSGPPRPALLCSLRLDHLHTTAPSHRQGLHARAGRRGARTPANRLTGSSARPRRHPAPPNLRRARPFRPAARPSAATSSTLTAEPFITLASSVPAPSRRAPLRLLPVLHDHHAKPPRRQRRWPLLRSLARPRPRSFAATTAGAKPLYTAVRVHTHISLLCSVMPAFVPSLVYRCAIFIPAQPSTRHAPFATTLPSPRPTGASPERNRRHATEPLACAAAGPCHARRRAAPTTCSATATRATLQNRA
jgi:hypothetical protein